MSDAPATFAPEDRLRELGLELPTVPPPAGTYVHAVGTGELMFLAGHVPFRADGTPVLGRLGQDLDADAGYMAARLAALGLEVELIAEIRGRR